MSSKPTLEYSADNAMKTRIGMSIIIGLVVVAGIVALIYVPELSSWVLERHRLIALDRESASYVPFSAAPVFDDSMWPQDFYNTSRMWRQANPSFIEKRFTGSGFPYPGGYFLLFSHARTAPTGEQRVVMIEIGVSDSHLTEPARRVFFIGKGAFTTSSWSNQGHGLLNFVLPPPEHYLPRGIRFFGGEADPRDPSRFTIRYEIDGRSGVIEGHLDPGGATISTSPWPEE